MHKLQIDIILPTLAVGSILVLLGSQARFPERGTLLKIDWEAIVLRVTEE